MDASLRSKTRDPPQHGRQKECSVISGKKDEGRFEDKTVDSFLPLEASAFGVPVVLSGLRTRLVSMSTQLPSLLLMRGLRIWCDQ